MKCPIIARRFLAIGLVLGVTAAGCGSSSDEWVEAIIDSRDGHHGHDGPGSDPGGPECPDICGAICAGLPEPELPAGCPIPGCSCEPPPECPDVCGAICAGLPEPELPAGCPIPGCFCG